MVTVTVCVGSSCHLKGAREVIVRFDELLAEYRLQDKVLLKGSFCMERCGEGVNWQIDEEFFTSVNQDDAVKILRTRILEPLGVGPADKPGGTALP